MAIRNLLEGFKRMNEWCFKARRQQAINLGTLGRGPLDEAACKIW